MAPNVLLEAFEKLLAVMKDVSTQGKKTSKATDTSDSTKKVSVAIDELSAEQRELQKIMAQINTVTAKNNATYQAQEAVLKKLKKEIKDRAELGDRDAKAITKQNASLKQLETALKLNREAYAGFRTEEARASEEGVNLLRTIQDQATGVAELREEMLQFNHNVGNYTGSIIKAKQEIDRLEKETLALVKAQKKEDQATDDGKKKFNQYNTQINKNITQINIYRNAVQKAAVEQKKLNSAGGGGGMGDALDGLGDLNPALGEGIGKVQQLSGAFKKLLGSPVGPYLVAIGAAVAAIGTYFTGSIEGQDRFAQKMTIITAYTNIFRREAEKLGKYLVDLWDDPIQAIKDYIELGLTNLVNRAKSIIVLGQAVAQAWSGQWRQAAVSAQNAFIQFFTGITNGTQKLRDLNKKAAAEKIVLDEIEIRNAKFKKDAIQDIIDDSIVELQVSKLLAKVKDDLRYADQDRLVALRKANALLEDQAKGDIELAQQELAIFRDQLTLKGLEYDEIQKLADLQTEVLNAQAAGSKQEVAMAQERYRVYFDSLQLRGEDYEEAQKFAELQAKVNKTEEAFFQAQKRRLSEEFSLVREIQAKTLAFIKAQQEAYNKLETWRLEHLISVNEKIIATERSTLAERFKAIVENAAAQVTLAQETAEDELAAAMEASKGRVNLSTKERKEIFENVKLSIDEQLALYDEAVTRHAEIDQAYVTESLRIEEERAAKLKEINDGIADMKVQSALEVLARDNDKWADQIGEDAADAMKALNIAYDQGLVDTDEYLKQRADIESTAQQSSLSTQLGYVNEQLALAEEGSVNQLDLLRQQAELELALTEETAQKKLEYEMALQEGLAELREEASESALEIMGNLFDAEDMKRQERLDKLTEKQAIELAMAGDNEVAKAEIENRFALESERIKKQQAASDRKRALFEKATAAIQIAINTALAISKTLAQTGLPAAIPLIAITAAIGAVQLAAVLSKPIPSYADGTDNHPGGLARFGEAGPELVTLPGGKSFLAENETFANLPAGSQVKTSHETMRALALEGLVITNTSPGKSDISKEISKQTAEIRDLTHTLRHKKHVEINFSRRGAEAALASAMSRTNYLNNFYQ